MITSDTILAAAGSVAATAWTISKILRILHIKKATRLQSALDILQTAALDIYHAEIRPQKLAAPNSKISTADSTRFSNDAIRTARTRSTQAGIDFDATIAPHTQRLELERAVRSLKALSNGRRVNTNAP